MAAISLFTTVSTKGQIILPKAIRDQLHWDAGIRLIVEHTADGVLLRPIAMAFAPTRSENVFGCLAFEGGPRSVEQTDADVIANTMWRYARGKCQDRCQPHD